MLIYIVIFAISAYLVYNFLLKTENEKCEEINIGEETSPPKKYEKVVLKTNVNYDGANIMTAKGPGNICVAIFKNPVDHKTHFYRTRLKGEFDDCPLEFRNIAASLRLWGKMWDRINDIKIYETSCENFENPSKWVSRLDDQREDCQTKFGCRIQFMDFAMMKDSDRKVLGDLSQKILENCISEDDMEYFRLQDDTSLMQKTFFDL